MVIFWSWCVQSSRGARTERGEEPLADITPSRKQDQSLWNMNDGALCSSFRSNGLQAGNGGSGKQTQSLSWNGTPRGRVQRVSWAAEFKTTTASPSFRHTSFSQAYFTVCAAHYSAIEGSSVEFQKPNPTSTYASSVRVMATGNAQYLPAAGQPKLTNSSLAWASWSIEAKRYTLHNLASLIDNPRTMDCVICKSKEHLPTWQKEIRQTWLRHQ